MSNLIAQSGIPKLYWCPSHFNSGNLWNIYPFFTFLHQKSFWYLLVFNEVPLCHRISGYPQPLLRLLSSSCSVESSFRHAVVSQDPTWRTWSHCADEVRGWCEDGFQEPSVEAMNAKTEIVGSRQLSLVLPGVHNTDRDGSQGQQLSDHLQVQAFLMVAKLTTLPFLGMEIGFHPAQNWHNSSNTAVHNVHFGQGWQCHPQIRQLTPKASTEGPKALHVFPPELACLLHPETGNGQGLAAAFGSSGCLAPPGLKLLKLRERIGRYLGSGVINFLKNVVNSTRLFRILEHFHSDMLLRWPTVLFNPSIITTIIRSSRSSITTPSPIPSPSLNPKSKT